MASPDDTTVELRGQCPREIIDVIDAWSAAKHINRMEAVNVILRSWAKNKVREHTIFARVTKGNPLVAAALTTTAE